MQRKTFVLLITVAMLAAVGCGKKSETAHGVKPQIERFVQQEEAASSGVTKQRVFYIDRRNPYHVAYYYDTGMNGELSKVVIYTSDASGWPPMGYVLTSGEEIAEKLNTESIRKNLFDGLMHFWRQGPEAKALENRYLLVRSNYRKDHPEAKDFPENRSKPLPSLNKKIEARFRELLAECTNKKARAKKITEGRAGEIAQTLFEVCESEIYSSWELLPQQDKEHVTLTNEDRQLFYRAGIELDSRNPIRTMYEWSHTPQENDYKSAWTIYQTNEVATIITNYRNELAKRGLVETIATKQ